MRVESAERAGPAEAGRESLRVPRERARTRAAHRVDPLLVAVLLAFVVLAGWYSVTIPLGEAPDEVPHFTYIRYLARHWRIPSTVDEHEAFQPPLYYALAAGLTFWVKDEPDAPFAMRANANFDYYDPLGAKNLFLHPAYESWPFRGWVLAWHLVRLLSVALGAITVWATYRLGRIVFAAIEHGRVIALGMAALVALTPQFLFMSGVANNDNAATALSAVVLWQVAALLADPAAPLEQRARRRSLVRSALLGVLLGLGLLSKANLIALVPVVGLAILAAHVRRPSWQAGLRAAIVPAVVALGLAALLSGWYFIRNWQLHGDPLGWSFLLQVNARREEPLTLGLLIWLVRGLFRTFWLGWMSVSFERAVYWLIGAVCLGGLAGFVAWLVRSWRGLAVSVRTTLLLLSLYAALIGGSLIKWTVTVQGTDQGRLIYPLLPVVALVLVGGWAWWARGRARPWAVAALGLGLAVLAVLTPLRYIAPLYEPAPIATDAELAAAVPVNAEFGPVRLLGYRLENREVQPGGKIVLHLYWQARRPIERDLMSLIQLVDGTGQFLMYADGSPTAGRDTTDRWPPGVPLASRHVLPIPAYGQPGDYRLTISFHPFGQQTWLPVSNADGSLAGDHLVLPEAITIVP